jgi:cell wall-associated NlpC family hydrolase
MRKIVPLVALVLAVPAPALADDGGFSPGVPIDPGASMNLVNSAFSLADVDTLTGTFLGDVTAGVDGYATASQLLEANAMAFDVQAASEMARADLEARKQAEEQRIAAEARAKAASTQTEVGPDGCPTAVPPRTLRAGAEQVGAYELCIASVASAPTAAAAKAIKFTFVNLGVPYSRTDRMGENAFDCSSYVMRAYESAGVAVISNGWAPTTHTLAPYAGYSSYPWLTTVSYDDALPGDLLLRPPSASRSDGGGHVAMLLAQGFMVHTAATGDVSHVTQAYSASELFNVRRVIP